MWLLCYGQSCVTTSQQLCPERPCATLAPHDFAILKLFLQPTRAVYQRWSMVNAPLKNKQISTLDNTRSTKRQSLRRLIFQTQLELQLASMSQGSYIHLSFYSFLFYYLLFAVVLLYYSVACVVGVLQPLTLHLRFHPLGSGQEYRNTRKTRLGRINLVENTQSNLK